MTIWLWLGFLAVVGVMLALDLGVFHRKSRVIGVSEAAVWTTVWVITALLFNAGVYFLYEHHVFGVGLTLGHDLGGREAALQFFTGYIIEKSLSLDNIFVIALIFSYFGVPGALQHRVLFWGILGALLMRGVMIAAGAALIHRFEWITYVFGGMLILTAIKMFFSNHANLEPERNPLVRLARRIYPVAPTFDGQRFFTRMDGRRAITPLFLVLLVVESSDVLFAIDSIPAIFAVTKDPFLVFTSNVFAILGLRSLYFVLAGVMEKFRYLKTSLVVLLAYVGVKMLLTHHYPIPIPVSLGVIGGILTVGVLSSLLAGQRDKTPLVSPMAGEMEEWMEVSWRGLRRMFVALVGATLLVIGLALVVLPGPAMIVIPAGLGVLATEFLWARKLLERIRESGKGLLGAMKGQLGAGGGESGAVEVVDEKDGGAEDDAVDREGGEAVSADVGEEGGDDAERDDEADGGSDEDDADGVGR